MSARQSLPDTRPGKTYRVACGDLTLYATVNEVNAAPVEVFLSARLSDGVEPATNGFLRALAQSASIALRNGATMDEILRTWERTRFEPSTVRASSPLDAVARRLRQVYPGETSVEGEATP